MPSYQVVGVDRVSGKSVSVTLDAVSEADVLRNPIAAALDGVSIRSAGSAPALGYATASMMPKVMSVLGLGGIESATRDTIKRIGRQVRFDSTIVGIGSMVWLMIAVIVSLARIVGIMDADYNVERYAASYILAIGLCGIVLGFLLRAFAAYMRMMAVTCDFVSESIDSKH